ncbi:MAG TPA: TonB-dependent receptor [Cytophagaceae bacterium]
MKLFKHLPFCLLLFFVTCLKVEGQEDIYAKTLKIKGYKGTLEGFLNYLKEVHNLSFSYSHNHVPPEKEFAIEQNTFTVKYLLDYISKTAQLNYNLHGNQIVFFKQTLVTASSNVVVSGHLTDKRNGEALIGVNIYNEKYQKGTLSNAYGFYSITLPADDSLTLTFEILGYTPVTKVIQANSKATVNIALEESIGEMNEVIVESSKERAAVNSTEMSTIRINPAAIRHLASVGGEVDIIKVVQLMPGITRGVENGTQLFVRGGTNDQNLILLDEATVYNVGHLFGFFSVFNNDAIKDITVLKGGFPANYGGRLSSMMDVRMKEGNMKKFEAEGGIGLLSSRLTVQGPIWKDKVSFIVSGRRSYIDQVFKVVKISIPYYFYDLNAKLNYKISDKDRIYISSYLGNDVLRVTSDAEGDSSGATSGLGFVLGNITSTLRWNHIINKKLFYNVSLINTRFRYLIDGRFVGNSIFVGSKIQDLGLKTDFEWYQSPSIQYRFGVNVISHVFKPNVIKSSGEISQVLKANEPTILTNQEYAVYGLSDITVNPVVRLNIGLRVSGAFVQNKMYNGLEPRFAVKHSLSEASSLKFSYSRMLQYMHLVSSSSVALPTDLWYPVTKRVRPLSSDQVALGYIYDFKQWKSTLTIEGYYKKMRRLIEYKEGASVVLNNDFEEHLVNGKGDAYGLEFLLQKNLGKLSGWLGYTLSWSTRKFDDINNGKTFFAKYDRRHNASVVLSYDITKRISFSTTWVYLSGSRFTPLVGNYVAPHPSLSGVDVLPIYTERNGIKLSDSHRLDVNLIFKSKPDRKFAGEFHVGAYNIYNRASPYRVNVVPTGIGYKYTQPGLFGFLPFIAYNFKF